MLKVTDLSITLGSITALRGLNFAIRPGETLGIVGESGSGKSITALAIMGLLPKVMRASGRIELEGNDLLALDESALCRSRGRRMAMIFQEPMTALNPVMPIGAQIAEGLVLHGIMSRHEAAEEAIRLVGRVGLPDPAARAHSYPHELSGGQRQRAMIAMAIACRPALLIADEPTSALDVTVQAEILALLKEVREETGMAMLFISHDLAVISKLAENTLVLYGGAAMEMGETHALLAAPRHPYTRGLIAAIPSGNAHNTRLNPIRGHVPELAKLPPGCPFHGRCPLGDERCRIERPAPDIAETTAWCHHAGAHAPLAPLGVTS
ncbi:MAG: ABC transporter ATP-binding protein [Rhizobiales bacterium PAR1]|nr:MAG: ABC transporter ATP-binding protein [Rhizobiales bacterium PAR1]